VQQKAEVSTPAGERNAAEQSPLVAIRCSASSGLLDATYAYLAAYSSAWLEPGMAERLNVAVYELLANAMRHGVSHGEVRIELRDSDQGPEVSITNTAELHAVQELVQRFDYVCSDPEQAYSEEMARFEASTLTVPRLGLVRVAHECKLELALRVTEGRVEVTARCPE
jgi:signal transduction histidine kinase